MKSSCNQNIEIPSRYIIEVGLCRKRDVCARCGNRMNVPSYNIQLCMNCRATELAKFAYESKHE